MAPPQGLDLSRPSWRAGYALTSALIYQDHTRIAAVTSQEQRTTSVHEHLNGYRRGRAMISFLSAFADEAPKCAYPRPAWPWT